MGAVVAELTGGLGNQLFQWAFAFALAKRTGARLCLDHGQLYQAPQAPREYTLDRLGIHAADPVACDYEMFNAIDTDGYVTVGDPSGDGVRVRGLWMGEGPWASCAAEIRRALPQPKIHIPGVAVHVRRTDFLGDASPMVELGADYYRAAIAKVPPAQVLIFSDDPAWCRANLPGRVVDEKDPVEAFKLMASCTHHVIANSSFSWWAAWLGEKGTVVAPSRWIKGNDAVTKQIVPDRWITV